MTPYLSRHPRRRSASTGRRLAGLLLLLALPIATVHAHEGEVHAEDAPPAAVNTTSGLPGFVATSELFELVGRVDTHKVYLFLDRFADNAPVKADSLEVEIGSLKLTPKQVADGEFEAVLPASLPPGVHAVTATVVAGNDADLLAASLDMRAPGANATQATPAAQATHTAQAGNTTPAAYAKGTPSAAGGPLGSLGTSGLAGLLAGVAGLVLVAWIAVRKRTRAKRES